MRAVLSLRPFRGSEHWVGQRACWAASGGGFKNAPPLQILGGSFFTRFFFSWGDEIWTHEQLPRNRKVFAKCETGCPRRETDTAGRDEVLQGTSRWRREQLCAPSLSTPIAGLPAAWPQGPKQRALPLCRESLAISELQLEKMGRIWKDGEEGSC